jgi:hypothetical protein
MKHPVLRVKKGSKSYDDLAPYATDVLGPKKATTDAGEAPPAPPAPRRRVWLFRMRRGSLLPLLILVVIAVVLLRVLPRSAARADIGGWHAVLEARVHADTLDVGVAFSRLPGGSPDSGASPTPVSVRFVLADTGQEEEALGMLSGERMALVSRMRYTGVEKSIQATVRINNESRALSLPVPRGGRGP